MSDVVEAFKRLEYSMSLEDLEKIIEEAPKLEAEEAREIVENLYILDGILRPLMMVNQAELGLRLAESLLSLLDKLNVRGSKRAFLLLFKAEMQKELGEEFLETLREAFEEALRGKDASVLARAAILYTKFLDYYGKDSSEVYKKAVEALLERPLEELRGDGNLLIFAANALGKVEKEKLRELLERLGFVKDSRLLASPFVIAMFSKHLSELAKELDLRLF